MIQTMMVPSVSTTQQHYPQLCTETTTSLPPLSLDTISLPPSSLDTTQVEEDTQSTTSRVIGEQDSVELKSNSSTLKLRARRGRKPKGLPVDPFKIGKITVDLTERIIGDKIKYMLNISSTIHKRSSRKYKCSLCVMACNKVVGIKRHNAVEHALPYTCAKDGLGFASKVDFREHMIVHGKEYRKRTKRTIMTDPGHHQCDICKKLFMHHHTLKAHMRIHDGIRHPCEVCGKLFKHIYNMKVHMFEHTGGCKYECKVCGKKLPTRALLRKHSIKHQDIKPYSCNICSKAFPLPWRLKKHMQIHNPVKSFTCSLCGKAFVRQDNLNQHLKTHNKDSNKPTKSRQRKAAVVTSTPPTQIPQMQHMTPMPQMSHHIQQIAPMQVEHTQDPHMIHQFTIQQHQQEQQRQMLENQIQGAIPDGHRIIQIDPLQQQQLQRPETWDFSTCQFRSVFPGLPGFPGYQC